MALLRVTRAYARLLVPSRHCASSTGRPNLSDAEKLEQLRAGIAPATGRPLKDIAAELWDHNTNPAGPQHRSGLKILQRPLKGHLYTSWYLPQPWDGLPDYPLRKTPKQLRRQEKLKALRAAGKGPPKKGAGSKRKK